MRLPNVLVYHAIHPPPKGAADSERVLFVDPDRFLDQMEDLRRRGYRTLSLDEFAAILDGGLQPPKSVLLTFDDGYAHIGEIVTPVLRRYGFRAVMFAPFGHLGSRNTWDAPCSINLAKLEIATAGQVLALDRRVWEVASHGFRHIDLRKMDPGLRRIELVEAREYLGKLVGRPVLDLAYPHGLQDPDVCRDAQRAGYRLAFTVGYRQAISKFKLPRWPVSGDDTMAIFRIKTSAASFSLHRAYGMAPPLARRASKIVVRAAAQAWGRAH